MRCGLPSDEALDFLIFSLLLEPKGKIKCFLVLPFIYSVFPPSGLDNNLYRPWNATNLLNQEKRKMSHSGSDTEEKRKRSHSGGVIEEKRKMSHSGDTDFVS
jgi:hypothetical protein